MGSRLGPNYACLLITRNKSSISTRENKTSPVQKISVDDIAGGTSGRREEIDDFATYVNGFHPSLNFTWVTDTSDV